MAYTGGIDYVSPPYAKVDWEEVKSPWSIGGTSGVHSDGRRTTMPNLTQEGLAVFYSTACTIKEPGATEH